MKQLTIPPKGTVRTFGKFSKEFTINTGVRQGDVLAPIVFNLFFGTAVAATLLDTLNPVLRWCTTFSWPSFAIGGKQEEDEE